MIETTGSFLKWFEHVERIRGEWSLKKVYEFEVYVKREKGKPFSRWLNGIRKTCNAKSIWSGKM